MNSCKAARLLIGTLIASQSVSALCAESYNTMAITLPLISPTKVEFNLKGHGGLALELSIEREIETFSKEEREERNQDSMMAKGQQVAALYSQYSNPKSMSGGFWTLGAGYRRVEADWLHTPDQGQATTGLNLDADGKLTHEMEASGATGHARVGYRYVGESVPFLAGIYVGLRHFQSTFKDKNSDGASPTNEDDLVSFQRRMATKLEAGLDIGFAF